jgi:hypothetical protein
MRYRDDRPADIAIGGGLSHMVDLVARGAVVDMSVIGLT